MSFCALVLTSCNDQDLLGELEVITKPGGGDNTEITVTVTRDGDNGIINATKTENGVKKDTTIIVPLGGVNFTISPLDTVNVANSEVSQVSFTQPSADNVDEWNEKGVYFKKTTKVYTQVLSYYTKDLSINYLDAYTFVWGKKVEFPAANGKVEAGKIEVLDEGINGANHYYLSTTFYAVSFQGGAREEKGFERLAVKANDVLISTEKTGEGYETLTENTAKSWIEITRNYQISGPVKSLYEVVLRNKINSPFRNQITLADFALEQKSALLGQEIVSGNRVEASITITEYSKDYTVGNNKFDRLFGMSYEKAVWSDGKKTYDMPHREYTGVADNGFVMEDMGAVAGYDRKLYTHKMGASFNSNPVIAIAETEIRVAEAAKDELKSTEVLEEGFDFVNNTTSNTWVKVRETWSISGTKEYTKSVNVMNGISAQAKIKKILDAFGLNGVMPILAEVLLQKTETKGDFTVRTYTRKYTVGNDKFTREFTMTHQQAVYNPISHQMPYKEYENISDNGYSLIDMSNASESGKNYQRKGYVHTMGASFNGRAGAASSEADLLVEIEEPSIVPSWMGKPVKAVYTRVQQVTDARFMDMIYFEYENGCILAPLGKVDLKLTFAFSESLAKANGVKYAKSPVESAVWTGSQWFPAAIVVNNGRWIYAGASSNNALWSHTVHQQNAVALGIGVDVTYKPKAQSFSIEGKKITITYAVNNGKTTADTPLSLR